MLSTPLKYADASKFVRSSKKRGAPGDNVRKLIAETGRETVLKKARDLLAGTIDVVTESQGTLVVCKLSPTRTPTSDGYIQLSGGQVQRSAPSKRGKTTEQVNVYGHHLLLLHKLGDDGILSDWSESISHLCNHPDCLDPTHTIKEPLWKNIRRQSCKGPHVCDCDDEHKCLLPPTLTD